MKINKNIDHSVPDFKLHELYGKPSKNVVDYLGKPDKLEKYSIDTSCEMGYYEIYYYNDEGLTISAQKSSYKPSSMDDVGRSATKKLHGRSYVVESILFKNKNYKTVVNILKSNKTNFNIKNIETY